LVKENYRLCCITDKKFRAMVYKESLRLLSYPKIHNTMQLKALLAGLVFVTLSMCANAKMQCSKSFTERALAQIEAPLLGPKQPVAARSANISLAKPVQLPDAHPWTATPYRQESDSRMPQILFYSGVGLTGIGIFLYVLAAGMTDNPDTQKSIQLGGIVAAAIGAGCAIAGIYWKHAQDGGKRGSWY
jgi:hypothetical protein